MGKLSIMPRPTSPSYCKTGLGVIVCIVLLFTISQLYNNSRIISGEFVMESVTSKEGRSHSLKAKLQCLNKEYKPLLEQHGDYWILKNYIRAEHGDIDCYSTVTYTTHADVTFLENMIPLLNRWRAPLSVALYAPGDDYEKTLDSISYYRDCHPEGSIVRQFTTFHIYFESEHFPSNLFDPSNVLDRPFTCPTEQLEHETNRDLLYKTINNLTYPINVGRNLARRAALTKYILPSDIELFPNPGLAENFLNMILDSSSLSEEIRNAYVLPIFEVREDSPVPVDKKELHKMFYDKQAIWFHYSICATCHSVPMGSAWLNETDSSDLRIYTTVKRQKKFNHWEPIFIGTNEEPFYDERLSWEGKSDKMTQGYVLCVLDYNFHLLSNGFLVHKPGIKKHNEAARPLLEQPQKDFIKEKIFPEITKYYGSREGCIIH